MQNMNTLEKSKRLAKFMGWKVIGDYLHTKEEIYDLDFADLYHPKRMAVAWHILQFAYQRDFHDYLEDWVAENHWLIFGSTPRKAQTAILDELLCLFEGKKRPYLKLRR